MHHLLEKEMQRLKKQERIDRKIKYKGKRKRNK
jgi:hypothetical protein